MLKAFATIRVCRWLLLFILPALLAFLIVLAGAFPRQTEYYYSEGFYRLVCTVFHPVFNIFPFSVGDCCYVVLVLVALAALVLLVIFLFRQQWKRAAGLGFRMLLAAEIMALIFYALWGFNYYRPGAAQLLNLQNTTYNASQLAKVTGTLIDSANACRQRLAQPLSSAAKAGIYRSGVFAMQKLAVEYPALTLYRPLVKSSMLSFLLNYLGTSGYYNPFTAESQVNDQMPYFSRPFVTCHELSHQMGIGPEDEANFLGFLAGSRSADALLRYSAYYAGVQEFLFALRLKDSVAQRSLRLQLSPAVRKDMAVERTYWLSYEGRIERLSSFFYDRFLKANNQPQGLKSYNQMVSLLMAYSRSHPL